MIENSTPNHYYFSGGLPAENLQKYMIWFAFFTLLSGAGSFALAWTTIQREEAEKKLQEEVQRYADLFQHGNDAIFIVDPETRSFLDVNETAAQYLGYSRAELLHLKLENLYAPEDAGRNAAIIKALKEKGEIVFEHVQIRKDGSKVPVEISSRVVYYGERSALQSFVRDISERKQSEKAREDLLSEPEKRNAELERFTYTVSHDLKSPLVTIKGFLGLLKEDIVSESKHRMP